MKIGERVHWFDVLKSTNEYLTLELDNYLPGEVIITHCQSNGLGMGQNTWESETRKNLTFSFFLKPKSITAGQQFFLNICISLGVFDFVKAIVPNQLVKVKWPNDIYINEGKVAGILIKNAISGNQIMHTIIGIGLNVNQLEFKSEVKNPVSLRNFLISELDLQDCLDKLCVSVNHRVDQLEFALFHKLKNDYIEALFGTGEWRLYKYNNRLLTATIKGISEFGMLKLKTREGEIIEGDIKEIEFVI
ncbi:MAG: biotin--[acetyl-CoA-carboxylase] ligase [Bacteroidales bacterium]|nr:biotin--[acetyl-CoA-carboxylase] ligase [Bacteroidales bacterium]MCF8403634.1 biotin--[acetyl-CoA-carboxylase] ligase [Bacteroidales bacterium]